MQFFNLNRPFTALIAGAAIALTGASTWSADAGDSAPSGEQLLAQTLDAHGGLDRFRSFGTFTYRTEGLPYSTEAPLDFAHVADLVARHHRMEGSSAAGSFIAGSNATQGWTTDAEALGIPPRWVNHGNSYFVMMPFVFADPGTQARFIGERTFDGETFDVVGITYASGTGDTADDDYLLYIDKDTKQLRLIDFIVTYGPMRGDTPIDELPRRSIEFTEWQSVDGLFIPRVLHYAPWERTASGGKRKEAGVQYTISDADFAKARPEPSLFVPVVGATIE